MNPMQMLTQMLMMGNNPQQAMQNLMQRNPQFQAMVNQVRSSGMSMKDYALNYAKQNNIDINPLINMLSNRGIKL